MPLAALKLHDPAQPDPADLLTLEQNTLIGYRYNLVVQWREMVIHMERAGVGKMDATTAFLKQHPEATKSTLYRWDKALRDDRALPPDKRQGLRVLLDHRTAAREKAEQPSQVSPEAWQLFIDHYNAMPPLTVVTCWHIVKAEAGKHGWHWPALRTIQRWVSEPRFQVWSTYFRLGAKEWERQYAHKTPRSFPDYRAGEWLMSDFHELDVFCRRREGDSKVIRPLLMAVIDIRSRKVALLLCEHENQRSVQAGLARWIRQFGVPQHWTIDNGKPFRATGISGGRPTAKRIENEAYLTSMCGQMGIAVHFSIAHNPNGKSICERFFGTIETQLLRTFFTWCGPHKDDTFRTACKRAETPENCPTLDEVREAIDKWVELYHNRPHTGESMDGLTPNQAFDRFDPIPLATAPPALLDQLLMLTAKATVTSSGVLYKGIHYSNYNGLFNYMGQKVLLRVREEDAGTVSVWTADAKTFICDAHNARAANVGLQHAHVSEGQRTRRRAVKLVKQVRSTDVHSMNRSVLDNALAAMAQDVQARQAEAPAATGTDDVPVRNVKPVRPDLMDRLADYHNQAAPPAAPKPRRSVLDQLADQDESPVPAAVKRPSVLERLDD